MEKIPKQKHELGANIWVIYDNKIREAQVTGVQFNIYDKVFAWTLYDSKTGKYIGTVAGEVYKTKADLVKIITK